VRESGVVIIGAGPAGLAAAACLGRRGIESRLLDRSGQPGGAYRRMSESITLASPTDLNALPGLPLEIDAEYTTVPQYRAYLDRYAAHFALRTQRADVSRIEQTGVGFTVRTGDETLAAFAVVVATGMWDYPREVHPGGELPAIHAARWRGPAGERRLLVIGGGTTGIEVATEAARAGVEVILSVRRPLRILPQRLLGRDLHRYGALLERLPVWLARRYCAQHPTLPGTDLGFSQLRRAGRIDVRPAISAIEGKRVRFADGSEAQADAVVAATGYRFDTPFLPPEVARAPAGHLEARGAESVSWPGLFVLGTPCAAGLDSHFLRGIARDAELVASRIAALSLKRSAS